MGRKKSYESDGITVHYEIGLCMHAAECVGGLPEVFNPKQKPWVEAGAAGPEAIAEVIERCPSGALTYTHADASSEHPESEPTIRLSPNGPLHLRGNLTVTAPDGTETTAARMALCRCGQSQNKPFCDNSHVASSFQG